MANKKAKAPTKKSKGGRPKAVIDYEQLDRLCAIQCTGEECAAILGMDYDTLNKGLKRAKHGGFTEYFAQKSCVGKASLRRRQFRAAEEGNATMLVWLGKQWLGQIDKPESTSDESSSSIGKIQVEVVGANAIN